jgi:hypothetical protein
MTTREEVLVGEEPNRKDFRVKKQKVFKPVLCHYLHLKRTAGAKFLKIFKNLTKSSYGWKATLAASKYSLKKKKHG